MRTFFVTCAAALVLAIIAPATADAENLLVLNDGSAIAVDEMTVRGGRVEVRLPDSDQPVAYSVSDVDLEASGLVPDEPPTSYSATTKPYRGGFEAAIAEPPGDTEAPIITDQDVEHVRPPSADDDEEGDDEAPVGRTTSLLVSNLQREVSPSGVLTVTGTVTNSGDLAVTAIAITGDAKDSGGASLGRGTTGISSTLAAGEATEFSIAIPVNGTVANVKVTAVAAMSEFTFEPVAAPQEDDEEDFGDDYDEPEEDLEE